MMREMWARGGLFREASGQKKHWGEKLIRAGSHFEGAEKVNGSVFLTIISITGNS
jgi:hypothetical protein